MEGCWEIRGGGIAEILTREGGLDVKCNTYRGEGITGKVVEELLQFINSKVF